MKKAIILGLAWISTVSAVYACVNVEGVEGTTIDGRHYTMSGMMPADHLRAQMRTSPKAVFAAMPIHDRDYDQGGISPREVEGVEMIMNGEYGGAIEVFEKMERETPGKYSVAANLGTAYELSGDNENALKWINEGIARNPRAHDGTEWLHREILKAKIKLQEDPDYLKSNDVLALPANLKRGTMLEVGDKTYNLGEIREALLYQLGERTVFVKEADPVVADLLYSFARVEAQTNVLESANELLNLAGEYGFHDEALLAAKRAEYNGIIEAADQADLLLIIVPGVACGLFVLLILLRLRSRQNEAAA